MSEAMSAFYAKLDAMAEHDRFLCVGLDPVLDVVPEEFRHYSNPLDQLYAHMEATVEATAGVAAGFKPNTHFFEQFKAPGLILLDKVISMVASVAPDAVLTVDAKRGDIGPTNEAFVPAYLGNPAVDVMTIHPYLGKTANLPFLQTGRGLFVLDRTSNPDAQEFQDIPTTTAGLATVKSKGERVYDDEIIQHLVDSYDGETTFPLYAVVAARVALRWNELGNCGLVSGATYPDEMTVIRRIIGDEMPLLIPGVGTQGGEADVVALLGSNSTGKRFLTNISGAIAKAKGKNGYKAAAYDATMNFHEQTITGLETKRAA